jgi:ferredoxin-type protein NapH
MRHARWAVLALSFIVISVGLVLNTNLGTLSSFGWQAIATICPLGVLESALASKGVYLRAIVALAAIVALIVIFGKAFCSWICPVAPIRSLRRLIAGRAKAPTEKGGAQGAGRAKAPAEKGGAQGAGSKPSKCGSAGCSSCQSKRQKLDSRHLILGGTLLSAAIFGFPVFCLVCPIGLIFGTVIVAWQFIGFEDLSLSLLIYPALLLIELLVLRKWCARFCPLGALLSLLSLPNRFFKPVVNHERCLRSKGGSCQICADACMEGIDPHYSRCMNECSKCGACKDKCPTGAISFALMPKRSDYEDACD